MAAGDNRRGGRPDKGKQPAREQDSPPVPINADAYHDGRSVPRVPPNSRTSTYARCPGLWLQTPLSPAHARPYYDIESTPIRTDRGRALERIPSRERTIHRLVRTRLPAPSRSLRRHAFSHLPTLHTSRADSTPTRALPHNYADLLRWFPVFETEAGERSSSSPSPEAPVAVTPWRSTATTRLASSTSMLLPGERPRDIDSSSTLIPGEARQGRNTAEHPLLRVERTDVQASLRHGRRHPGDTVYFHGDGFAAESEPAGDQRW
ncbi:hypothetical protein OPT61_g10288 [Boeremia exigua]|uniref:Uncharacterized protein n=1 Tax=Boeremia exigua TaxID=749465 RepID=A0ACC2HQY8_9PLEO|nr:hypothetical protein OPT61_g10288 [Boeremia exigua]